MKDIKDNFSSQAEVYARFRPGYPAELFECIYGLCKSFDTAWDCATGNGQAAVQLADKFRQVFATDISEKQISLATTKDNIQYSVSAAHATSFADDTFDLVTVAQALHWFGNEHFYNEVRRVCKPDAVFAAWGYNLVQCNEQIDKLIQHFYHDIIGPYWDDERKHVDAKHQTLPFSFEEIECPEFSIEYEWGYEHFIGYLNSWSSVQHYIAKLKGQNPVVLISQELKDIIGPGTVKVSFPIFLRAGYIK